MTSGAVQAANVRRKFDSRCRLHSSAEFDGVLRSGHVLRGAWFELHYRRAAAPGARLGLIVSKRLAPLAVQRNLIKRLAREAFRHARPSLPPYELVLRLARAARDDDKPSRPAWRADLQGLLARLPK